MKTNTGSEIRSLDDELNLFDESEWEFMDVFDTSQQNCEYFNDIRDSDFVKKKFSFGADAIAIIALVLTVIIGITLVLNISGVLDNTDYKRILEMQSVVQDTQMTYVSGVEVSSEELVAISSSLNSYFSCIRSESDYAVLYDYCATTSSFADTYYATTNKVVELYDTNDCYARSLRKFASFCTPGKISKVVQKDGIYYCYLNFSYPSTTDVQEYINLYSYNMSKYFKGHEINDANIIRFLMDNLEVNPMGCHSEEYCIRLSKVDGKFVLSNDSFLTSICTDAYTDAVVQVTNTLGGSSFTE